jgi:hypothetical protein
MIDGKFRANDAGEDENDTETHECPHDALLGGSI